MKFPPAATYRSKIANDVASSVIVPNRIAPRLSTLTLRADDGSLPMVVYRMPPTLAVRAHSKSNLGGAGDGQSLRGGGGCRVHEVGR